LAGLLPATDALWHDVYHVIAPIGEGGGEQSWRAYRTDTAEEVILRVLPGAKGDLRADAWNRLCEIDHPYLQKAGEVHYVENYRVEICAAPRGVALDVWRKGRSSIEIPVVETMVRQLSEALGVLHANGLAHLGIQPGVVFVQDDKNGLFFTLAGLGTVVRFEGDKLISAQVNPMYAPPEAATLQLHEPGPAICGWDWWTLGRLTQELVLGHHVLDELPDADSAQTQQLRWIRAESLLFEQDPKGPRAGAVEVMKVDPRLTVLLRGLLTSSPEGRWGGEFVDRWLRQQLVKENYSDKRIESKFRWRGRLYTVPEAAKELQSAELWSEAASQVFKATTPGMLAHFIANMPEQHLLHDQMEALLKFAGTEPLHSLPAAVSREVVLMLALLQLTGEKLIWRGRRITGETLKALLAEEPNNPERFAFVRVLSDRSLSGQIERYDLEAGRSLATAGLVAVDAEALIRRFGWLTGKNEKVSEAIFRLAFESDAVQQAALAKLKQAYACAKDPALDKIFKADKPARAEIVALAWAEPKAGGFGFSTHAEMKSSRVADLTERGRRLAGLIFWLRLKCALQAGPLVFGQRWLIIGTWITMMLFVAVHQPGPLGLALGLVPFGLIALLRLGSHQLLSRQVKAWSVAARPWGWDNHFTRCQEEISQLIKTYGLPATLAETSAMFDRVTRERADLLKPGPCPPLAQPASQAGIWTVSLLGWILALAVVVGSIGLAVKTHPSLTAHKKAWQAYLPDPTKEKPKEKVKEIPVSQISWPYRPPMEAPLDIIARGAFNPDSAQSNFATERAHEQLKGYKPDTINSLVAIYVPLDGTNGGLLLYDGKKGAFMGRNGVLINFVPMPKMWMQIGEQRALFIEK
jgi:serine/threonine protein kinase